MTININKINKRIGIISSLLVPLFFFLSELFHPITMDTPAKEIISAQQNSAKWLIAHIFALFALILMPFLVVRLLDFINDNKKKIVIVPYIMAIIGTILTTGLLTFDFFVYVMGKIGTKEDIIQMYDLLNNSIYGLIFLKIGPIIFLLGLITLFILILLSNIISRWKSILILIGLLIYGLTGPLIQVQNGHILVSFGAVIMLIGFCFIIFAGKKD